MYIVFYIPVIIFLVSTLFCLISNGHNNFGVHFYSGKTENSLLINIQVKLFSIVIYKLHIIERGIVIRYEN